MCAHTQTQHTQTQHTHTHHTHICAMCISCAHSGMHVCKCTSTCSGSDSSSLRRPRVGGKSLWVGERVVGAPNERIQFLCCLAVCTGSRGAISGLSTGAECAAHRSRMRMICRRCGRWYGWSGFAGVDAVDDDGMTGGIKPFIQLHDTGESGGAGSMPKYRALSIHTNKCNCTHAHTHTQLR